MRALFVFFLRVELKLFIRPHYSIEQGAKRKRKEALEPLPRSIGEIGIVNSIMSCKG